MPKCDTCGFAHAQADHCINCGNTDPFRRNRLGRLILAVAGLIIAAVVVFYFYDRYLQIERSVRDAEQNFPASTPPEPQE
ncbi:MAG: hypothetical protein JHD33_05900 [Chthoniobacterales bacterium]|nr:hypothetical protein [Chthoniobacterales bacterium]